MNAGRDDNHTRSAYVAWLAVCVFWGVTYLAIRVALEPIPPALIGAIRYTVAGVLLAAILRARGERLPAPAHRPRFALMGFLRVEVPAGIDGIPLRVRQSGDCGCSRDADAGRAVRRARGRGLGGCLGGRRRGAVQTDAGTRGERPAPTRGLVVRNVEPIFHVPHPWCRVRRRDGR